MCLLWSNFFRQVMVTVTVSPMVTGRAKCSVWSIHRAGAGELRAEHRRDQRAAHMPWAMTSRNIDAYSGST